MNVCRHGYEYGCPDCDPETYYAEKRERETRDFRERTIENLRKTRVIVEPKVKPCGCIADGRPCAKACGLDMTGWFCEAEAKQQAQTFRFDFLNEREQMVLKQMSEQKDMSEEAVMRQALRMYQLVDLQLSLGHQVVFRNLKGEIIDPLYTGPKMETPDGQDDKS